MNTEIVVARCGLICSKCGAYLKKKCQGCHSDKPMFKGCPVKKCAIEKNILTCADCKDFSDLKECRKLNNMISKIISLFTKSNRVGSLCRIREIGLDKFKSENA
ncbi:MAG TPA: hypothetical protein DEE98_05090 [Elusimicrobia bacterium]|nr:MAG: hypothetical protein A2278_04765 [Elusimicrobia bacterium RIFOXYA12_FULL_49_49]OGS06247.1 MAG: hypothetical protein A2204_06130 [Elusimicrobia bacterium RIFOXYA1_FULL_47_7]OGS14641.1 MAG: hypothetical protein A2251_09075 [Elusimicrobia bacterium RIFOXYA2_FULL_47_53]OGS25706.1 MAG: hypothetical protein A2339_06515 [Elusimicrobia bacterium RIFOXYB12_FULL_50_12]OGS31732.1 MAG: hypothetical protein A2323_05985 [Elusimicrobia bacterium RIFOXYB2_FULL_46_23]HBU69740.1 hypothetical protein [El